MPLNPETATLMAGFAASGAKPFHQSTPAEARAAVDGIAQLAGKGPAEASVRDMLLPGTEIRLRLVNPAVRPRAMLLYCHGGGWVAGSVEGFEPLARAIAKAADAVVVLVDYRLAPEHPFPAGLDDCWRALQWLATAPPELGSAAGLPLMVAGDSAGGNLAAVLALRSKAAGLNLQGQALLYPVTDCNLDTASCNDPENQLLLSKADMAWFWNHYAPAPMDRRNPELSPLRAPDLAGLPPALVITCEYDVVRDEGQAYAARLSQAGVPTEQVLAQGDTHAFLSMLDILPSSQWGVEQIAAFVRRQLSGQTRIRSTT